jgi:hypothetical protein
MANPKQSVSLYTWGCSLFAAVGSLLYGIDSGIISTTISQPAFLKHFAPFTPSIKGAVVSIFSAGSLFGVLFAGWAADYWGNYFHSRRRRDTANQFSPRPQKNYPVRLDICIVSRDHSNNFNQCGHANCRSNYWRVCRWYYEHVPNCFWSFGHITDSYRHDYSNLQQRDCTSGQAWHDCRPPRTIRRDWINVYFFKAKTYNQWVGFGSSYSTTSFQWRFPLALRRLPPISNSLPF